MVQKVDFSKRNFLKTAGIGIGLIAAHKIFRGCDSDYLTGPYSKFGPQYMDVLNMRRPVLGMAEARVTLLEISDYNCIGSKRVQGTLDRLLQEYVGELNLTHINFPILKNSEVAARAVEAAGKQGKYWLMHNMLFRTGKTDINGVKEIARDIGLNTEQFARDFESQEIAASVARQKEAALGLKLISTPVFIIGINGSDLAKNGVFIFGAAGIQEFEKVISGLLDSRSSGHGRQG